MFATNLLSTSQRPTSMTPLKAAMPGVTPKIPRSALSATAKTMSLVAPVPRLNSLLQTHTPNARLSVITSAKPQKSGPDSHDELSNGQSDKHADMSGSDSDSEDYDSDISTEDFEAELEQIADSLVGLERRFSEDSGEAPDVNPAEIMALLRGDLDKSQLQKMNAVSDKARFFEKLGVLLEENCDELSGDEEQTCQFTHSTAEIAWEEYQGFQLQQLDQMLSIDRLAVGAAVATVLKDDSVDSSKKAKLTFVFNIFMDQLRTLHRLDLEPYRQNVDPDKADSGLMKDELPLQVGQLSELIELRSAFKQLLEAHGQRLDSGAGISFSSGLKAKSGGEEVSTITFDDVAGIDEAKQELTEVVDFLKNPERFQAIGARIPRGVLLEGGPGVGKTLLAKAVAGEAGVPFFSVAGSEFVEEYVGVGAKRVRDLFDQARMQGTCIIFIDEIDAVGRARQNSTTGGGHEHEQTLNQILVEMDGFGEDSNIIILGATNRADLLDSALVRPGRFDRKVQVPLPAIDGREAILKVHARKINLDPTVNLGIVAKVTSGFSGADLENLVNEAALHALRNSEDKAKVPQVTADDFEAARDRLIMGPEMKGYQFSDEDKRLTAYHEAGHALVSHFMDGGNDVFKITIMPRGNSLGATHYTPPSENGSINKKQLFARLASLLGGRMAEGILLGEDGITTGASSDLRHVSRLARSMVSEWGFSDKVGLGNLQASGDSISEHTRQMIDDEVSALLVKANTAAKDVLLNHRAELEALSELLMEKETVDGSAMVSLLKKFQPEQAN